MTGLHALIRRNCKLFFKDKGMFITSLITPAVLLVLYTTFLAGVYRDAFTSSLPSNLTLDSKLLGGLVGGQLVSSLLAVSCVTVAFCSNMLMVQDKVTGARRDLQLTPVKPATMALGYYCATLCSTLLVCLVAAGLGLLYLGKVGWYLTAGDVALLLGDIVLLVFFGTALSSIINLFLSTQGQISAVGTIVCSGYGFICGAYMPISSFSTGLQRVLLFLPGTYGTALLRCHTMRGAFAALEAQGLPEGVVQQIADSVDCKLYFFDYAVGQGAMYLVLGGSIVVLLGIYILLTRLRKQRG